jgi:hypothetical protein
MQQEIFSNAAKRPYRGANPEAIDPELQMMRPAEKDENNMRNA